MEDDLMNLENLKRDKKDNFKKRLEFIDKYVEWLKREKIDNGRENRRVEKTNKT